MRSIFNYAIVKGWVTINPMRAISFLRESVRVRRLTQEEHGKLFSCLSGDLRKIVILALNTGMRRNEIVHLKWADVNFREHTVLVQETKNGKPRTVPLNSTAEAILVGHAKTLFAPYVFYSKGTRGPHKDVSHAFKRAAVRAGVRNFRFHDLRHTFASNFIDAGGDAVTLKEILGHSTMQMTAKYCHPSDEHKINSVKLLDTTFQTEYDLGDSEGQ